MSTTKTVCFFSGDITRSGGTERVAVRIANSLAKEGNYRICFASLTEQEPQPFYLIDERIPRRTFSGKWINPGPGYLKIIPKLRRFLRENRIDLLIDIDIVLDVLSIPAAKGLPVKVISWEHFNYFFEQKRLYRRGILHWSVRRSDYVVTLTQRDKENYGQYLGRTGRIRAIPNPVEPELFAALQKGKDSGAAGRKQSGSQERPADDENDIAGEMHREHAENWILTAVRLVPDKGIDYLVEVAEQVLSAHPDWQWLVLGDGEQREFLKEQIRARHLEGRLIAKGRVKNIQEYLKRAKLFALTSREEGLPMCLLEAKTSHLPCVSFDIMTGPAEIIADGVNGYLIEPFDCRTMAEKIGRLIEDETLREQFAAQADVGMEKFLPEHILEQWNQVIEEVCGRRR